MPTFVALLRGINVGKAKRVSMAELRTLLSGLGYTNVATLLNSGNAVFRAPKGISAGHATEIAAAISDRLKLDVPVIVKSARELATIIAENPIRVEANEHSRFLVVFVQETRALPSLRAIGPLVLPPERFEIGRNAAYFLCPGGILQSKAWEALLGKAGRSATTRNWATVIKLGLLTRASDV
jgi:uncharacterized protein (DUF1697 family)